MYVFSKKHVRLFPKTRTCFFEKSYMFFGKHVRLFTESYGKELEHTEKYTISLPFSGGPKAFPPKSPTRIIAVVLESRKSYLIKKETGRTPIKT